MEFLLLVVLVAFTFMFRRELYQRGVDDTIKALKDDGYLAYEVNEGKERWKRTFEVVNEYNDHFRAAQNNQK